MHGRAVLTPAGRITIRVLRSGDTAPLQRVFAELGERSRRRRFGLGKSILLPAELERLSCVDARRHVHVAYAGGQPVGIAHLVREDDPAFAEIAAAVADGWQGLGIGTALVRALATDAATVGIACLRATIDPQNRPALALMRRVTRVVSSRMEAGELHLIGLTA
jgi:GNAT superfamily N-acetyltransferase